MGNAHITDEAIAAKVQAGDTEAFGYLVERYEQKMMRYAYRFLYGHEDAEDMVQEVFIKAYTNIRSFNTERQFSSWLYRIAHNTFINEIKRKKREPVPLFDIDVLFPHLAAGEDADKELHRKEIKQMVDRHLGQLDSRYREPLVLYYFEELNYKQIAEILRVPISTVGVRIRRGKMALKHILDTSEKARDSKR